MNHSYTKSQNVEALSIYNQQYRHKKNGSPTAEESSRKHLLGLLSSFTRQQVEVKSEEVEELCCYDRMKKLIYRNQNQQPVQQEKDLVSAIVIEQKMNQLQAKINVKRQPKLESSSLSRLQSSQFMRRSCMIQDVKKQCLQKYLSHKRSIKQKGVDDIRKLIEKEVDERVQDIIEERKNQFTKLQQQKIKLEKQILAKQLEIEALRSREGNMKEYILQLQERCKGRQQTKKTATPNTRNNCQMFIQKFNQTFNGMTVEEVKNRLDVAVGKCLQQFDRVENRNQQRMRQQTKFLQTKCEKYQETIHKLQTRQNQLATNLRNLKINKQISEVQVNQLCKAKARLENLQKVILSIYNEWYAERSQSQKKLMKSLGNLSQNYSYEEMLKYIVDYGKKYSTNEKLNDYLFKILRGVQKIKRVINPDQCNQKLDALTTLQKIEKWVKIKVTQHMRFVPKKKTMSGDSEDFYLKETC